ncbi:hypothetical protein DFH29DRAFT_364268 [Suillus ampliporus]|nr:hypothetical protein DFH29DRAFT_364268 [Suillus ampliporus]
MSDLESPYSRARYPSTNHSVVDLKGQSISAIITERQQQLDAVIHDISSLETAWRVSKIFTGNSSIRGTRSSAPWICTRDSKRLSGACQLYTYPIFFVYRLLEVKYLLPTSKLAPMLLIRICRRCRVVVVGMLSLWCRLCGIQTRRLAAEFFLL